MGRFYIGVDTMIKIGNREIGKHEKPFIIAEMSGNHNQSLERALHLVELAKRSRSRCVKITNVYCGYNYIRCAYR